VIERLGAHAAGEHPPIYLPGFAIAIAEKGAQGVFIPTPTREKLPKRPIHSGSYPITMHQVFDQSVSVAVKDIDCSNDSEPIDFIPQIRLLGPNPLRSLVRVFRRNCFGGQQEQ
jgi:hypothetical protein